MSQPRPRERYQFTVEGLPDPDGVPVEQRLKALLKIALRRLKLRCVACRLVPAAASPEPPTGGER